MVGDIDFGRSRHSLPNFIYGFFGPVSPITDKATTKERYSSMCSWRMTGEKTYSRLGWGFAIVFGLAITLGGTNAHAEEPSFDLNIPSQRW